LPTRVGKTRKDLKLTRMGLAARAGVSEATALYVETGRQVPTVGTIAKLAEALGVSAPWLAYGLGEASAEGVATCDGMGERLRSIRTERGYTRTDLARMAERSPPTIAAIEDGGQAGVDTIETLAKALGVSPGWLAYGLGPMEPPSRRRTPRLAAAAASAR